MPLKPPKPCQASACPHVTRHPSLYCDEHESHRKSDQKEYDSRRGSAAIRGYDRKWRKYRKLFLMQHALCVECERQGRLTEATIVDHIVDHNGDHTLFWDPDNHQSLCKPCHDRKTAATVGFNRKQILL